VPDLEAVAAKFKLRIAKRCKRFNLEEISAKKHHCIQLSVKTLHKALAGFGNGDSPAPDEKT